MKTITIIAAAVVSCAACAEYVIQPGDEWVTLKDSTVIKEGTALDFSKGDWIDAPCGKHGRVVVRDGHFEFANKPGVKQRFYGVNLCFTANYNSKEKAEELATRLSRLGYNALRIHHHENTLVDKDDSGKILPERMAELDNLLNACRRRGIYVTTDLYVSRRVRWRECGIERDGFIEMKEFKELVLFHPGAYSNYLAFAKSLLTHVNPETGKRWADEETLAFLALVNEGNPGNYGYGFMDKLPEARAQWEQWLADHKKSEPEIYANITTNVPSNCWANNPQNAAYSLFLTDVEIDFAKRTIKWLREEIGTKALLTDLSCWKNAVPYQMARQNYDYVDDHFYVDHPHFLEKPWRLPSQCPNTNPIKADNLGFEAIVKHRELTKPFTITEFNYSGPGQFRGVGGILLGAQAALQDYDGIWRFAWSHSDDAVLDPKPMTYFDVARDPLQRATERAVIALYLRRDIEPLKKCFAVALPESRLRTNLNCGPQADIKDMWYGWYSKFGTTVSETKPEFATESEMFPEVYSKKSDYYKELAKGRKPGDGQVAINREEGTFAVITPRTCGLFTEGGRIAAGALTATIKDAPAAVWVSSLDQKPITSSKHLLVTHVADVQDTGTVYREADKKILEKWGDLPHMMRRCSADIGIAIEANAKVFALNSDGSRKQEIKAEYSDGTLRFQANTGLDSENATYLYEIVR